MRIRRYSALMGFGLALLVTACGGRPRVPELRPVSHEAQLVEVVSPAEWLVSATGYSSDRAKDREKDAVYDARCSAIYFVLFGGENPLLRPADETGAFGLHRSEFLSPDRIGRFIAWEPLKLNERVVIEGGKRVRVVKDFKVNRDLLRQDLVQLGILDAAAGGVRPVIMVIPRVEAGRDPVDFLMDPDIASAAAAIESHLTARRFEVRIPQQGKVLDEMVQVSQAVAGIVDDPQQKLALCIGSDIYICFQLDWESSFVAGTSVQKATATVQAFETTTGKALGSETGYSKSRPSPRAVLAEEAINGAIAGVITKMEGYWRQELEQGAEFLLVIGFEPSIPPGSVRRIQGSLSDAMRTGGWAQEYREEILTERNAHYRVWCSRDVIHGGSDLVRRIEDAIRADAPSREVRQIMVNRKLVLLQVT
jgi:hypothetical protein